MSALFRPYSMHACWLAVLCMGCDASMDTFPGNTILVRRYEVDESISLEEALGDTSAVLEELFGTPDQPRWPACLSDSNLVSADRLQRAAGAVSSDENGDHLGLYREHCVVCHGVSGDGMGPTAALLNPYPRDFRMGKFKFKSTPIGKKPTRQDIKRLLQQGIVGTSMPAFNLLEDKDLEALVDYVIYLSIRGEVERRLLTEAAVELDLEGGERVYDPALGEAAPSDFEARWSDIQATVEHVARSWQEAENYAYQVPARPADFVLAGEGTAEDAAKAARLAESLENGKQLFQGTIAGCAFCHGMEAKGDGQVNNYDEWTRDWTMGLDPRDERQLAPLLALGALKPRNILPRNLQLGNFRGGGTPEDLYMRIANGIEGTPMPAAPLATNNPQGLSNEQVWDIVNYLWSLSHGHSRPDARENATQGGSGD